MMYLESGKGVICVNLAQYRGKWLVIVNTVMNFSVM